ncbi:MAG: FAD:protein FMN transferase [Planctomycetota bacterium]|jgi:thiamine biosynthesis lipoprotein
MRQRAIVVTVVIGVLAAALLWRRAGSNRYVAYTRDIMAAPISVLAPEPVAREAADIVFGIFQDLDERMSEWKDTSPLSAVNAAAGGQPVEVPDDLRALIRRGIGIGGLTGGAFDITWGALWDLWDFQAAEPWVPGQSEIESRVALVDFRQVVIDDEAGTVHLPHEGMLIGLGGIAKGHALDESAKALRDRGIDSFLISAAGQMILGGMRGDRPWRVGIRNPRGGLADYFARLELTDTSIASSGDYERYFMLDGVRYHHILDPATGRPARGLRGTTVICTDATLADALSTALMVMPLDVGLDLAESLDDVEAVVVDAEGEVHTTSGLTGRLLDLLAPADGTPPEQEGPAP